MSTRLTRRSLFQQGLTGLAALSGASLLAPLPARATRSPRLTGRDLPVSPGPHAPGRGCVYLPWSRLLTHPNTGRPFEPNLAQRELLDSCGTRVHSAMHRRAGQSEALVLRALGRAAYQGTDVLIVTHSGEAARHLAQELRNWAWATPENQEHFWLLPEEISHQNYAPDDGPEGSDNHRFTRFTFKHRNQERILTRLNYSQIVVAGGHEVKRVLRAHPDGFGSILVDDGAAISWNAWQPILAEQGRWTEDDLNELHVYGTPFWGTPPRVTVYDWIGVGIGLRQPWQHFHLSVLRNDEWWACMERRQQLHDYTLMYTDEGWRGEWEAHYHPEVMRAIHRAVEDPRALELYRLLMETGVPTNAAGVLA